MEPAALLITAIVGAVSALIAALIAARKLTFEREHSEAETAATWTDAQAVVIGNLLLENKQLRARQDTYEAAIQALQQRIREVEQQNRWLVRENTVLRHSLNKHGIDVPEFRPQP
jgi:NADH:ubiquinone oxidoreductase subunit 3 (subunit A)